MERERTKKIIEDWNTIEPEYRTPEKLVDMVKKDFAEELSQILGDYSIRDSGGALGELLNDWNSQLYEMWFNQGVQQLLSK